MRAENILDKNEKFFNLLSPYYDRGLTGRWLSSIVNKTVKSINIKKNSVVLDAGCGTGNLLLLLEKRKDISLYGVDISEKMLSIARKKIKRANIQSLSVLLLSKNFKSGFFDYVFVIDAFHHFPNQETVIQNFYKVLKKDGTLVITDLDFGIIFNKVFHFLEPGNSKINSKKEMKILFEESGFFVSEQKKIGLFSFITVGVKLKGGRN